MYSALPLPFDDEIERSERADEQALKDMSQEMLTKFYEDGLRTFDNIVWPVKKTG